MPAWLFVTVSAIRKRWKQETRWLCFHFGIKPSSSFLTIGTAGQLKLVQLCRMPTSTGSVGQLQCTCFTPLRMANLSPCYRDNTLTVHGAQSLIKLLYLDVWSWKVFFTSVGSNLVLQDGYRMLESLPVNCYSASSNYQNGQVLS